MWVTLFTKTECSYRKKALIFIFDLSSSSSSLCPSFYPLLILPILHPPSLTLSFMSEYFAYSQRYYKIKINIHKINRKHHKKNWRRRRGGNKNLNLTTKKDKGGRERKKVTWRERKRMETKNNLKPLHFTGINQKASMSGYVINIIWDKVLLEFYIVLLPPSLWKFQPQYWEFYPRKTPKMAWREILNRNENILYV